METTIELEKIIDKELMIIDSKAKNKHEVLTELVELLVKQGYVNDHNAFLEDVYLREQEGETGIGQGIAIPHGKSQAVQKTTVAIATLDKEIEWETLDGKEVKAIILFAVKDSDANTTHVLLLQQIAILLANDEFLTQLKAVTSVDELFELIVTQ
ncbi:fructose PTS transporter subunit IIA [Enterococcus devriesei]|uniref:fructose PTS transporter subunit IIA n=1 Tax=Enterococcus devriesei TaxID=319970 RepID=UPI0036D2FD2A